jgi:hypothetical protein
VGVEAKKLTLMLIYHLPTSKHGKEKEVFVLALPDFDSQNIMVDEEDNLDGILNWDLVQTVSRFLDTAAILSGSRGIGIRLDMHILNIKIQKGIIPLKS